MLIDVLAKNAILDRPNLEFNDSVGIVGSTHPDSLTAMLLVEPDLIRGWRESRVVVETASELTRGYSLVDDRPDRGAPNARVIDEIDAEGFYRAYCRLLAG